MAERARSSPPPDEPARVRIRADLDHTLFVEAGAGAGKTSALVDRVVQLVEAGTAITSIAAITFTEKAAAELRQRLRDELGRIDSPRAAAALADLDHAPVGTLHAFARRILDDFPIDAGLPPGFDVLDPLESDMHFDDDWQELLDTLLGEPDPPGGIVAGGRDLVDLCGWDGFRVDRGLRQVAADFRWNWDLVERLVDRSTPSPLRVDAADLASAVRGLATTAAPPDDAQHDILTGLAAAADALDEADGLYTTLSVLDGMGAALRRAGKRGNKTKWRRYGGDEALATLRDREVELAERLDDQLERVRAYRKRVAGVICGRFVLDGATRRATAGHLEFHDLLVHARHLLATNRTVRRHLHGAYERLLLDEFQDTDPIQLEIAVRIAADPDDPAQDDDWRRLVPLPGRLFIVGDPKQSIYRFRRADIAQYLRAAPQLDADVEQLSANFRSTAAVIDFTNDVFARLITHVEDAQPSFHPLVPNRSAELLGHGTVTTLGADGHDLRERDWPGDHGAADELRHREAVDVVGAVTTALADGWLVADADADERALRPCRPGDICILLPTRISLPALERELRAAAVPYRAENSAVVYASEEIRDLLMALRAADDPTDELALVAALRSELYGCSDTELWEWKQGGGTWRFWRRPPDGLEGHPVADALAHLRSVAERTTTTSAADLLAALVDERRVLDVALDRPDARDVWHRVRFVVDQARAWADAGGRGLRRYLAWAHLQASEGQVSDVVLPEHDRDAVRIMTVHAAKGLEFPITVVSGLSTQPNRRRGVAVVWDATGWHLTGRGDDGSFAEVQPIDELMGDAERRRLLYVACTRAVDHLVVSLHRSRDAAALDGKDDADLTSAELLWRAGASGATSGAVSRAFAPVIAPVAPTAADLADDDIEAWRDEREQVMARAARRGTVAATRLAEEVMALGLADEVDDPGLDKQPVNLDLPPWQRGRYGTSIGRAVHGTLQFCDLDTGRDIVALARSQCAAEGILGLDDRVAALARSAIGAPIVRQVVAGAEHWRELFVAAPVGGRVLEGYVDLLVRTPSGLVIVDYKTDQWSGPAQTAERVGRYRMQLAAYGAALEVVLGEPITAGVLVRCRPGEPAEQIDVPDWDDALAEVVRLVA